MRYCADERTREMSATKAVPSMLKKLFVEGFLEDPYPTYRRFLSEGPIHSVDYGPGTLAVFSHADCSSAIRDPRLSARRTAMLLRSLPAEQQAQFSELARMLGLWMLFMDAPEHTRLRKLMNKGFSPAVAESLRPQVEAIVERQLEPLRHVSEADLLKVVAYPLPVRVIVEMLGVPDTMHEQILEWSDAIAVCLGNPGRTIEQVQAGQDAVLGLTEFFGKAVAQRRKQKGSDLISLLLDIEADGEVLTEEELHAQCVMLLFGGHETTRNLIGNGVYTLLRHPKETAELRENPELIRSAVEELLRYESPVQYTGRAAQEEMEICGARLHPGEQVIFFLGAANRDPSEFRDPDKLDLGRLPNPHLSFGAGAHFCIGNQLARLESQVAILQIIRQFPKMRLTGQKPEWTPNYALRGLKTLPVAI